MGYEKFGNLGDSIRSSKWINAGNIRSGTIQAAEIILASQGIIRSSNFVSGSAGFKIQGNGNAEFNNVTVRGTIYATAGELGSLTVTGDLTMTSGRILFNGSNARIITKANPSVGDVWIEYRGNNTGAIVGLKRFAGPVDLVVAQFTVDGDGWDVAAGSVLLGDGVASLPALTFGLDRDTGIIRHTTNTLAIVTAGTQIMRWTSSQTHSITDGSDAAPAYSFNSDTDTGVYRIASNALGITAGGTESMRFIAGRAGMPDGSAAAPGLYFTGDTDTGIAYQATNSFVLATGGSEIIRFGSSIQTSGNIQPLVAGTNSVGTGAATFGSGYFDDLRSPGHGTTGSAANTFINSSTGRLFRSTSSVRYKRNIKRLPSGLEILGSLKPVTFQSKNNEDDPNLTRFGLIAEEVVKHLPDLIEYDRKGRPDGIQYIQLISVLVRAVQELEERLAAVESR